MYLACCRVYVLFAVDTAGTMSVDRGKAWFWGEVSPWGEVTRPLHGSVSCYIYRYSIPYSILDSFHGQGEGRGVDEAAPLPHRRTMFSTRRSRRLCFLLYPIPSCRIMPHGYGGIINRLGDPIAIALDLLDTGSRPLSNCSRGERDARLVLNGMGINIGTNTETTAGIRQVEWRFNFLFLCKQRLGKVENAFRGQIHPDTL